MHYEKPLILALMFVAGTLLVLTGCNKDEGTIPAIEVGFDESSTIISEDGDAITVTLVFPASKINASIVAEISGTAVYGTDYTTSPAVESGTIAMSVEKGDTEARFTFTPIDNEDYNEDLTVIAELLEVDNIDLSSITTYTITISDDGDPLNETIKIDDEQSFNMKNFLKGTSNN
ncbi:MAG: hypothetical protein GY816_04910 [Cytophagales bacterium]|nr:hypothetical protein [Cytophagales bacterium]